MSDDLIDPDSIFIPDVNPDALEDAAADLRTQGGNIAESGGAVKSSWSDLRDHYVAPEAETLFAVMDPVSEKGDEVDVDLGQVAAALETFAETARDLKAQLVQAKADAQDFLASIEGDDDWDDGGFLGGESDKVGEHNDLLNRVNSLAHRYWAAERDCANAITALFGGTRFVGADADGGQPREGEVVYGTAEPFSDVETPWGSPQSTDHWGHVDLVHGAGDVLMGTLEDFGGAIGLHGDEGWLWQGGSWTDNFGGYWGDSIAGLGAMVGVYNPETGEFTTSLGEAWDVARGAWGDAIHGLFPWTELGERPGYVFGTLLTNVGMIAGGAALSATGLGAVVGVPMIANRVNRILGSVGRGGDSSGDGSDGGDGSGQRDGQMPGTTPNGNSQRVTRPESIEPGEGFDTSGIGDMSESLSQLNATRNPVPDQPSTPPAADPAPEPGPQPETGDGPPQDRPSTEPPPEPDPEQSPERRPEQTGEDPDRPRGEDPAAQDPARRDPTAEEVDDAFSEIARRNEDLADAMDDIDGGRMAELDGEAPWTIDALEDSGADGGRGGPDEEARVPVTPDGLETSRNDPEGTEGTGGSGTDPRLDGDSRPVEVTEDPRAEDNPPTGGGGGDRPPGGGPPGGGPPGGGGGDGPPSPNPEPGSPTPESRDGGMGDSQEASVRDILREHRLQPNKIDKVVELLRNHPSRLGSQIADIIIEGRITQVRGFGHIVSDFGSERKFLGISAELRFVDNLIRQGYPPQRLEFGDDGHWGRSHEIPVDEYDVDAQITSPDGDVWSYQIKRTGGEPGVFPSDNALVKNAKGALNQLRELQEIPNLRTFAIMEVNAPQRTLSPEVMRRLESAVSRSGSPLRIYFTDGMLTIPPNTQIYPPK